ncbi:MAG: capsule biosynthesis protein [Pseudomonadota bacterium]
MTTVPKAKKFKIRRPEPAVARGGEQAPSTGAATAAQQHTKPLDEPRVETQPEATITASSAEKPPAETTTPDSAQNSSEAPAGSVSIEEIKKEGLTGRQLRMARRVAQKHKLGATSDFDAVRLLRERGIDPFQRTNTLELVVPGAMAGAMPGAKKAKQETKGQKQALGQIQLPQTVPNSDGTLPSTEVAPSEGRINEIRRIQLDIAKRRRRKLALLLTRLAVFVFLPTLIAGYYFYVIATPMYATKSEFLIQQAEAPSASGIGGLLGSTPMATAQDSIAVQGYLESREALLRLDADVGFKAHFSDDKIDSLQRLEPDATDEDAYKIYKRNVKIGYDPTEGIVRMEVIATDPAVSAQFARALVSYAEERVDNISLRVREDAMAGARASYEESELKRSEALNRVITLQENLGVLDPASANAILQNEMNTLQTLLLEKELQLSSLQDNARPNAARVSATEAEIRRLSQKIADVQSQMTSTGGSTGNQARKNAELRLAEEDYQTRTALLQSSLQAMETARIEAERQVRYLSLSVSPVPPDAPTYPRKFENTILAFLIFAGIYLMVSLTASILREQVSS